MEDALIRFLRKIEVNEQTGCWEWQGAKSNGYGQFKLNGKKSSSHQFAHMHFKGPIPEGYEVDHRCRNHSCANPEHLEAVTVRVNRIRRSLAKTHCKRGHELPPYEFGKPRKCETCVKAYHKEWVASNYEQYTTYQREYNHTRRGLMSNIT